MNALILIDIQNDFLPGGALAVPHGDEIIPVVNELVTQFELVVATQDWHPKHHNSFASRHGDAALFSVIDLNGLQQVLWPDHCVQGTAGAAFSDAVNWNTTEAIFRKGMDSEIDSYSGFFDNGKRKATGMADFLKGRGVQEVFIAGLAADYCVYYTAKDALDLGFTTTIIENATRAISTERFEEAKQDLVRRGGRIMQR
jgi:nicotinamidase/pyrazinamidase